MTKAAAIHLLTEFTPVLAFFIAGQFYSFFTAATILVILTAISLVVSYLHDRSIPFFPLFSGAFVIVSGVITVCFKAPDVLILADSLYYFSVAAMIWFGLIYRFIVLKWIFERTFAMHDTGWVILSWRWCYAFILAGIGNEIVRIFLTPDIWVDYKFVKVILIGVFGFYQFTLSRRYRITEVSNRWGLRLER